MFVFSGAGIAELAIEVGWVQSNERSTIGRCRRQVAVKAGSAPEKARIPLADGTLVPTPGEPDPELIPSLLAASDVLGIGWSAAVAAEAGPGKTVAVVGDGAVGLMAILAAKQLGAERIVAMSRHPERQKLARSRRRCDRRRVMLVHPH